MAHIIDGNQVQESLKEKVQEGVRELREEGVTPHLAVLWPNDRQDSQSYVRMKRRFCKDVDIEAHIEKAKPEHSTEYLTDMIREWNEDPTINGIIVQSPGYEHLDDQRLFDTVAPEKDVDGLGSYNKKRMEELEEPHFAPATPSGIIYMLEEYYGFDLEGIDSVVVGAGRLVGAPLIPMLKRKGSRVTFSDNPEERKEDIVCHSELGVTATNAPEEIIYGHMIKPGSVWIDASFKKDEDGNLVRDIDIDTVKEKASAICYSPGGVGPVTIGILAKHVLEAAGRQSGVYSLRENLEDRGALKKAS